ncbi:hypothetical protein SO802_031633 [Lithocarpus litseifolius]|uniref:Uncharacterized protein n=1 Tax=Lithocarpus litseifolius TaxID=425828 RepID=A0AAW2BLK1_9ROSI
MGFIVRADKKEIWKEVKQVLESQELESSKNKDKQQTNVKNNEVSNIHKNKDNGRMKDNVISNTHANKDKWRMKIKDNVVSNIYVGKKEKRTNKQRTKNQRRCNFQHPKQ